MRLPVLTLAGGITAAMIVLTGCGGTTAAEAPSQDAAGAPAQMGMCAEGVTDCVDMVVEPEGGQAPAGDEFPAEQARAEAETLLGVTEGELPEDVRVGRRGEEIFMLTEDYVLGRMTVELDEVDDLYVVTVVTVELPEGPLTLEG